MSFNHKKILLVEGQSDQSFFRELVQLTALDIHIPLLGVATAKDLGHERAGKKGILEFLETVLKQTRDQNTTHLGIVLDADSVNDGWGYNSTIKAIQNRIREYDYVEEPIVMTGGGLAFAHADGLNNLGVWIMPDNQSEGMLEDWIKKIIHPTEESFFAHAQETVKSLPKIKFQPIHQSKAEVATWMAWQKMPGQDVSALVSPQLKAKLIDQQSNPFKELIQWLKDIYTST